MVNMYKVKANIRYFCNLTIWHIIYVMDISGQSDPVEMQFIPCALKVLIRLR